jgi:rod shape-determining protein MreD
MKSLPAIIGGLWLAGILQAGASPHMSLVGVAPDFLLIFGLGISLHTSRPGAAGVGFFAGLIYGGLAGANITHYIISRCVACFATSWSRRLRLELNYPTVAATIFTGTVIARIFFMFTAAPQDVGGFLRDTIAEATYNGVLALPLYALVKRVMPQTSRRRI